jgi:hypothetical protein
MRDVVLFLGYGENTNYTQHQVTFFTHGRLGDTKPNFTFLLCMWVQNVMGIAHMQIRLSE